MSDDLVALNVKLPAHLRERARKMASERRTSTTALIVEALEDKVSAFEAKKREERDLRRREEDEARQARRRALVLTDPGSLAPSRPESPSADRDAADDDAEYLDHPLYVEHAERVRRAVDATERRLAVHEAIEAIAKQYPITTPPPHVVVRRLEKILLRASLETTPGAPPAPPPAKIELEPREPREREQPSFLTRFFEGFGARERSNADGDPVPIRSVDEGDGEE